MQILACLLQAAGYMGQTDWHDCSLEYEKEMTAWALKASNNISHLCSSTLKRMHYKPSMKRKDHQIHSFSLIFTVLPPSLFVSPPCTRFLFSSALPSLWLSCVSQKPGCVAALVCSEFIIVLSRAPIVFLRSNLALPSVFSWCSAHFQLNCLQTFALTSTSTSPLNHRFWCCKLGCALHVTCVRKKCLYCI